MNAPARSFEIKPANADQFPLSVGLMGWPGAGKTFSALTLASGMRTPDTGKPIVIDTEGGRAAKYGPLFDFDRIDFAPPFRPTHILAAIHQAIERKPCAVIVDSLSDEHEGEGGVLDWHETELQRMAGEDWGKRERVGQAAWIKPKSDRRMMINGFLRIKTPLIFCFRAREKVKPVKDDRGRSVPTSIGFQPIAPLEIVSALDLVCFLPPNSGGVPKWQTDSASTDFVIKLPAQFRALFDQPGPITADHGRALAAWAKGGTASPRRGDAAGEAPPAVSPPEAAGGADPDPDAMIAEVDKLATAKACANWAKTNTDNLLRLPEADKNRVASHYYAHKEKLEAAAR